MASVTTINEPLLDCKELAALLKCSTDCVRKMARAGLIPSRRIGVVGKHYRFRPSDIDAWLNESSNEPEQNAER